MKRRVRNGLPFIALILAGAQWIVIPAEAQTKSPPRPVAKPSERWRTSMSAFAGEVIAVAATAKIPNAAVEITHVREYTVFKNAAAENIWATLGLGLRVEEEFQGVLAKRFQGKVVWRGVVKSAALDNDAKAHVVDVMFPVPENVPKPLEFAEVRLSIPFTRLPADQAPAKGSDFAFTGYLRKEKPDAMLEPLYVLYGLGPNSGKVLVGVILADVEPAIANP